MLALVPMTAEEYETYLDFMAPDYAREKVEAGNWPEEGSVERSFKEMREVYLPQGVGTENQYLYSLVDPEIREPVGMLWYEIRQQGKTKQAFVYDIIVYDDYRRQGYGSEAFIEMEKDVKLKDVDEILLHVFGYNSGAKAMYDKLGFEVTNYSMRKRL